MLTSSSQQTCNAANLRFEQETGRQTSQHFVPSEELEELEARKQGVQGVERLSPDLAIDNQGPADDDRH